MPESEKKKRARKSPRSSAKDGTNAGSDDPSISSGGSDGLEEPEKAANQGLIQSGLDTNHPDGPDTEPQETTGNEVENGVTKIHYDQELVEQVITEMITSVTINSLAEDIANNFCEPLMGNSEFRRRLIDAAMQNETFRSKLSRAIIKEFN
jgi:hypothetical protein